MALYDQQTSIKASSDEMAAWRAAADANHMPLITWIRMVLDHAAGVSPVFEQLEAAAIAQETEHAAELRRARNAAAAERRADRERRARGELKPRGRKKVEK